MKKTGLCMSRPKGETLSCPTSYSVSMISDAPSGSGIPWFVFSSAMCGLLFYSWKSWCHAMSRFLAVTSGATDHHHRALGVLRDLATVGRPDIIQNVRHMARHDHQVSAGIRHCLKQHVVHIRPRIMADDNFRTGREPLALGLFARKSVKLAFVFLGVVGGAAGGVCGNADIDDFRAVMPGQIRRTFQRLSQIILMRQINRHHYLFEHVTPSFRTIGRSCTRTFHVRSGHSLTSCVHLSGPTCGMLGRPSDESMITRNRQTSQTQLGQKLQISRIHGRFRSMKRHVREAGIATRAYSDAPHSTWRPAVVIDDSHCRMRAKRSQ